MVLMAHTSQTAQGHTLQLVQTTNVKDTDYTVVTAGGANTETLVEQFCIVNNDAVTQSITVKLQTYVGSYASRYEQTYSLLAGASQFPAEFIGLTLAGAASNPPKITVVFTTAELGVGDTIDCQASSVLFA